MISAREARSLTDDILNKDLQEAIVKVMEKVKGATEARCYEVKMYLAPFSSAVQERLVARLSEVGYTVTPTVVEGDKRYITISWLTPTPTK